MSVRWTIVGIVVALAAAAAITAGLTLRPRPPRSIAVEGAVILEDSDPKKESPIAGVIISVDPPEGVDSAATAISDFSGYFRLELP
jgi:hypothetical protein